jgi:hypothetical protein
MRKMTDADDWHLIRRFPALPKHEHVDLIVGDPLDHTAPAVPVSPARALIVIERSRHARGKPHPIPRFIMLPGSSTLTFLAKWALILEFGDFLFAHCIVISAKTVETPN